MKRTYLLIFVLLALGLRRMRKHRKAAEAYTSSTDILSIRIRPLNIPPELKSSDSEGKRLFGDDCPFTMSELSQIILGSSRQRPPR